MIESFNGRLREECSNIHWFESLGTQQKFDAFRWDYDEPGFTEISGSQPERTDL